MMSCVSVTCHLSVPVWAVCNKGDARIGQGFLDYLYEYADYTLIFVVPDHVEDWISEDAPPD